MSDDPRAVLAQIREQHHQTGAGEPGAVCVFDRYPTTLDCTCHHGHNRHSGKPGSTRCMSYYQQPDCSCTEFVPAPGGVTALWESHGRLADALEAVLALIARTQAAEIDTDFDQGYADAMNDAEALITDALTTEETKP